MKKALLLLLPIFAYSLEVSINTKCKSMRDHAFFPDAKVHNSCVVDDYLQDYIKCRSYYKHNMLNGLNSQGKKEEDDGIGDYTAISNYNYFNKEIKNVLEKEVKKQIAKDQSIMCIVNSEASLLKYEESIAEQEWCYAPKFLSAFDDELMNEHEMKYNYFVKLYNTRSDMLESKEKPKNKTKLCGVYLECMSAFINAPHTQASSGLRALYEKTKKECISSYFTIKTTTQYRSNSSKTFADKGSLHSSSNSSASSKQVMHIDPKRGTIEIIGIKAEAKNRYEGEGDEFDLKSCSIVHKSGKTRVDHNPDDSLAHIGKHNIFNANSSSAFIEISVRNNNFVKRFRVPWSSLKSNGSWSGSGSKSKFNNGSKSNANSSSSIDTDIAEWRDKTSKGADVIGLQGEKKCKTVYGLDLILGAKKVNITFNAKININITPASKSDIDEFKLQRDIGESSSIRARKIELSKYEKEPNGIFGNLENSMYDSLSQKEQNSWNKVEKEAKKRAKVKKQEEQNKKDAKEFDNLSIDDLEMFTE